MRIDTPARDRLISDVEEMLGERDELERGGEPIGSGGCHEVSVWFVDGSNRRLRLSDAQLVDFTDAAMYGVGWFRYREGGDDCMLNMRNATTARVMRDGE